MTEFASFVDAILTRGELDACGPFADWLEEHGDPRGPLLRKRWRRWQAERGREMDARREAEERFDRPLRQLSAQINSLPGAACHAFTKIEWDAPQADRLLKRYVRERFMRLRR